MGKIALAAMAIRESTSGRVGLIMFKALSAKITKMRAETRCEHIVRGEPSGGGGG